MFWFTEIMLGEGFVEIICTDPYELEWVCEEVSRLRPAFSINVTQNNISNEPYIVTIENLADDDVSLAWWLLKQMCVRGWMPLNRTALFEHGEGPQWSYFRLLKET